MDNITISSTIALMFDSCMSQRAKQRDILVMIGDVRGPILEIFDNETFIINETRKYIDSLVSDEYSMSPFSEKTQKMVDLNNSISNRLNKLIHQHKSDRAKLLEL